ncbi:MAG: DEAD/DEAH box helicase [Actinomycetes bacterium]
MSFKDLGVNPALVQALDAEGISAPFPIQTATLPEAISGRDILGRGQTGSGKTLAFGLAMLTRLAGRQADPHHPLGLILAPTRELAVQINDVIAPLARRVNLNSQVVAGGLSYTGQIQALKRGVPIIVATPGRLIDLLEKRHIELDDVEITVLDEADQMADMGFLPVVKEILSLTQEDGQRLLFSATLDRDVDTLVKKFLKNPITHSLENEKSRSADMLHHVLIMDQAHKDLISTQIAAREGRTIFFVRTKHGADKLADKMLRQGVPVGVLHGGKSQGQRTRVLAAFKDGRASALVATDVAARGIHVDDVSLVVHVDAPADHKDYLHRAGRTARAGATGVVVTLATSKQKKAVYGLTTRAGVKLTEAYVRPSDEELIRITGAQEPSGIPVIVEPEKPSRGDRGDRGGRGVDRGFRGSRPSFNRGGDRPERSDRPVRADRADRADRPARTENFDRPARTERPVRAEKFERSERPARSESFERPARSAATSRPVRNDRPERSERPARSESFERPVRSDKFERPVRSDKFERPVRSDKFERNERPARADKFERTERPVRTEKSDRPFRPAGKNDRPFKSASASRPVRADKFERPAKAERSDRSDRPARAERPAAKSERPFRAEKSSEFGDRTTRQRAGGSKKKSPSKPAPAAHRKGGVKKVTAGKRPVRAS